VNHLRRWAVVELRGARLTAEDQLKLKVSHPGDGVCVIAVSGEVDMMTVPGLDAVVAEQCAALPSTVVLDLMAVRFLGSSGLGSLIAARDAAHAIGAQLRLVCQGPAVLRPMDLTGLTELFEVYPDQVSALRGRLR